MRKLGALSVILLGLLLLGAAKAPVVHSNSFYVNDYAAVLSDSHRDDMLALSTDLHGQTGLDVVVLTVDHLGGMAIQSYGEAVMTGWAVGGSSGKSGALLLVSVSDELSMVFLGEAFHPLLDKYREVQVEITSANLSESILTVFRSLVRDGYQIGGVEPTQDIQLLLGDLDRESDSPFTPTTIILLAGIFLIIGRSIRVSRKYRQKYLKGNVRQVKIYKRSYNEEDEYNNEKIYKINYDGED